MTDDLTPPPDSSSPSLPPPRNKRFASPSGPRGKATPKTMARQERQAEAVRLRREGHTFREIARLMKITLKEADKLVKEAFAENAVRSRETVEQMVQLHNERLDWMLNSLRKEINAGSARAVEVAVKLLDRQARLLGLDAPAKQEVKVKYEQMSDTELVEEARRLRVGLEGLTGGQLLLPGETSLPPELERELRQVVDVEFEVKAKEKEAPSSDDSAPSGPSTQG